MASARQGTSKMKKTAKSAARKGKRAAASFAGRLRVAFAKGRARAKRARKSRRAA